MASRRGAGRGRKKHQANSSRGRSGFIPKGNDRYDRHDEYYRKAKREGFVARSVYKLEEIDQQFKLVKPTDRVLDLGCAPGSWMQYVAERLKPRQGGRAVGIDLLPVHTAFPAHVRILEADFYETPVEELLGEEAARSGELFDVVLSDMAPNTTGVRTVDQARSIALVEHALALCPRLLRVGGKLCVKVLEGGDLPAFVKSCRERFDDVKIKRPKGTRAGSTETYVVGIGYRGEPATDDEPDDD